MNDENWKEEFKQWKTNIKPLQIKLLEEGAKSQSQTLMLCDMWCEWKELATQRKQKDIAGDVLINDPWDDKEAEMIAVRDKSFLIKKQERISVQDVSIKKLL